MAATSIGGGEWLVGPAAAVKYSSAIFLIATVAIALQVIFNLEAIRYTLYTGEPIYGGIMRLKPGPRFWAGVLLGPGLLPGRMAGARRQRRRDAARRVDGPHARRARPGDAGLDRRRADPRRRLHPVLWRHGRAHARVLRVDDARRRVPVPRGRSTSPSSRRAHWWETFTGFFSFTGPAAPHRLGPDRRAGRDGGLGRHGQPHGDQLDPRQGLRHGRQGRRDPERRGRPRDPAVARGHGLPGDAREPRALARSGCATSTPIRSGSGACSASSGCSST